MAVAKKQMTPEEFLELPEEEPALEFDDGVISQKAAPNVWRSALQGALVEFINGHTRPRRLARAFPELRTVWPRTSRVPDVSVYAWDRIRRDPDGKLTFARWYEPPDIAIEVISPGQRKNAMLRRLRTFLDAGARAAVSVDPRDSSVLVVRPGSDPVTLTSGDVLDLGGVIPGLQLDIETQFDALRD